MEKSKDGNFSSTDHISQGLASSTGENKINIQNPRDAEVSTVSSERVHSAHQTSIKSDLSSEIKQPFNGKRKDLDSMTTAVSHEYLTTKKTDHNKLLKTDSASSKESGEVVQLSSVDSTDPIPCQSSNETLVAKRPCIVTQLVQSKSDFQERESSVSTRYDSVTASHFTFDLNEEMEGNGAISVVAKVGVPMGLPKKPLQFGGELGWKRSGVASAFRPTSFKSPEREKGPLIDTGIDLNVAATMDSELPADETSMDVTPKQPERFLLDLNCRSENDENYHDPGVSSFDLNDNPMIEDTRKHFYHDQRNENQQLIRKSVAVDTRGGNVNQSVFDMRRPSSYWVDLSSMRGYGHVQPQSFLVAAPTAEQVQMVVPSGVYIGKINNLSPTFYPPGVLPHLNNQPAIPQISGSVLAAYPGPLHFLEGPQGLNPHAYANMRPAFFPNGSIPLLENGSRGVSNAELLIPIPGRNGFFEAREKPVEQTASQISYRQMASWN